MQSCALYEPVQAVEQHLLNILLIESDREVADSIISNLRRHHIEFPVVVAEDGPIALDILRGEHQGKVIRRPLVILLDLNMANMNAFDFLRAVHTVVAMQDLIIFVLTSADSDLDRDLTYQHSILGYMTKSAVGSQFSRLTRLLTEYHNAARVA